MGQLSGSGAIFLSAGVPNPQERHFVGEGDSAAIVSAVSALLYVTLGRRRLVWGGHPAITPMVWATAEGMNVDYGRWVKLYQSRYFQDEFPEETARFQNVVFTEAVERDRDRSLELMRNRMFEETRYQAAVFIGGMQGIFAEYDLLRSAGENIRLIPLGSTGGAARLLQERSADDPARYEELDYVALLHEQLEIDLNERRYERPDDQPAALAERISKPEV